MTWHTCICKQNVTFSGIYKSSETNEPVDIKFYKLEECTFRFDKNDNNSTTIIVTKHDGTDVQISRDTFNLYFVETNNHTKFINDNEKILLVLYYRIDEQNGHYRNYKDLIKAQDYLERTYDYTVKSVVIPVYDGTTRLEALNPKSISDEKLKELNDSLNKWIKVLKEE